MGKLSDLDVLEYEMFNLCQFFTNTTNTELA